MKNSHGEAQHQYYIPTRYPNGLPAGAPCEIYTHAQAEGAVRSAEKLLAEARNIMERTDSGAAC